MSIPGHESDCPFQRLETCNDMLLVARMGSIHTYTYDRADDRFKYLWTWKAPAPDGSPPSPRGSALPEDARNMDSPSNPDGQGGLEDVIEPSAKRRRLEGAGDASETPVTVSSNGAEENGRTDSKAGSPQPNGSSEESRYSRIVCCMKATRDHLVATTYHDKAVRVFKVNPNGRLELLSER